MTLTTVDNSPYTYGNVYGLFSGKPTATTNSTVVSVTAGYQSEIPVTTNVTFIILPTPAPLPASNNVSSGSNVVFTITAGPLPLTYQWRFNATNIIAGATNASYTLTNAQPTNAGSFLVVITNTAGSFTSAPAVLTISASGVAPVITNQPASLTNLAGQPASFSVTAGGTAPLSYQWRKNGTNNIPGATGTNYAIANARLSDAGSFTVVITNVAGSITSSPAATLTVNAPPPPVVGGPPMPQGGQFLFTFTPVVGLTNTVLTNGAAAGGAWNPLTNVPPPATASSITVTDTVAGPARFYRVQIVP
ncbi:MAG: immunoglobulin domain-containing protein [Verrucomicrobia bacterium]|nr:immunoglobulin domain-containing protein [Verrucomicrobiota bacterium]